MERGPILALNLLNLDKDDKVNAIRFATAATPETQKNARALYEYQKFYNRDEVFNQLNYASVLLDFEKQN